MENGVLTLDQRYNFFKLPDDIRSLILGILENQYQGSAIKENVAMKKFRSDHNIPSGSSIKLSPIDFVYNGRKLCPMFDNLLAAGFMTYKQHIDVDYRARFEQPPNRKLFHEYRQLILLDKLPENFCDHDYSKKTSL